MEQLDQVPDWLNIKVAGKMIRDEIMSSDDRDRTWAAHKADIKALEKGSKKARATALRWIIIIG